MNGTDINQMNHDGVTALTAAAGAGHLAVVEYLVDAGCDVERTNHRHKGYVDIPTLYIITNQHIHLIKSSYQYTHPINKPT